MTSTLISVEFVNSELNLTVSFVCIKDNINYDNVKDKDGCVFGGRHS